MATFNKPIITTQGLAMLKSELSGSAPLSFTKVIFTSDDYSQLSDTDVANLNDVKAKDITAQAQTFVGTDSTTKVRATADNRSSNQAFYIKGYALYAKQNGNETLFAVAVSDTSDYVPAFNNKQLSQVSYTFQFAISETDNITLSDTHDIPVTQADIQSLTTYVNSKSSELTDTINQTAQSTLSSANAYTDKAVADKATHDEVTTAKADLQTSINSNSSAISSNATNITANSNAIGSNATNISNLQSSVANNSSAISSNANSASSAVGSLQTSINSNSSAISSNAVNIANNSSAISSNASLTSQAVTQINNNIENVQNDVKSIKNRAFFKTPALTSGDLLEQLKNMPEGYAFLQGFNGTGLPDGSGNWGYISKIVFGGVFFVKLVTGSGVWSIVYSDWNQNYDSWIKLGG